MKKHLHGKRHLRARRSVAASRLRKRVQKFNRAVKIVAGYVQSVIPEFYSMLTETTLLIKQTLEKKKP